MSYWQQFKRRTSSFADFRLFLRNLHDEHPYSICGLLVSSCIIFNSVSYTQCKEAENESINLYLKDDSRSILINRLKEIGLSDELSARRVQFVKGAKERDTFVYGPLFGQRGAFRLKGLITTQTGDIVGVGRISTMVGELKEESYEVALPIVVSGTKESHKQMLLDLPTRLHKSIEASELDLWKGHLHRGSVRGSIYPGIMFVTYRSLPWEQQVVVEGTICSSSLIDDEGGCDYDHSKEELSDELKTELLKVTPAHEKDVAEKVHASDAERRELDTDEDECPVCRYIKKGPCKEQFTEFDKCMQSIEKDSDVLACAEVTKTMMQCFLQHEYYDIMAAGLDASRFE